MDDLITRTIQRLLREVEEAEEEAEEHQRVVELLFDGPDAPPPQKNTRITINRDREQRAQRIYNDYFSENPTFGERIFERRFRMSLDLANRIIEDLQAHDKFWVQRPDACGRMGLSVYQKFVCAVKQLTLGICADATDDYVGIGETTALLTLKTFVKHIGEIYGQDHLRPPNPEELVRIMKEYEVRGLPGCKGSLDGMHWAWKNCPLGWSGQFEGKEHTPTVILEAVASMDLTIWHAFFGTPGALNDINVLNRSPLFNDFIAGREDEVHFTVNGNLYKHAYYLGDGIYPRWSSIIKAPSDRQSPASAMLAERHESARKDIERAFGVLQIRFAFVAGPCKLWEFVDMHKAMLCCIILHNMIVNDRGRLDPIIEAYNCSATVVPRHRDPAIAHTMRTQLENTRTLRNSDIHANLTHDLKMALWMAEGGV